MRNQNNSLVWLPDHLDVAADSAGLTRYVISHSVERRSRASGHVHSRLGTKHDWIVHGTQADFESDLPLSPAREKRTLAGPQIPYGDFSTTTNGSTTITRRMSATTFTRAAPSKWLFNVQQAQLNGVGAASWRLNRPSGESKKNGRYSIRFLAVCRSLTEPHPSDFTIDRVRSLGTYVGGAVSICPKSSQWAADPSDCATPMSA